MRFLLKKRLGNIYLTGLIASALALPTTYFLAIVGLLARQPDLSRLYLHHDGRPEVRVAIESVTCVPITLC